MSEVSPQQREQRARSFGQVADAYDRARPSYPPDAVEWLVGRSPAVVVELGAGTGRLTELLHAAGHEVLATDPSPEMLARLSGRVPVPHAIARAEQIPVPSRSADVVVCGQSFHWFDPEPALAEIGRVLRPGGTVALVWNDYDTSIPWVRRLARLLSPVSGDGAGPDQHGRPEQPLLETPYFGFVEERRFRFWQPHTAATLADYARSTSYVATLGEAEREALLGDLKALYDDYGRGPDGMQLPWLTQCFKAVVQPEELPEEPEVPRPRAAETVADTDAASDGASDGADEDTSPVVPVRRPPEDPGFQLIDFR